MCFQVSTTNSRSSILDPSPSKHLERRRLNKMQFSTLQQSDKQIYTCVCMSYIHTLSFLPSSTMQGYQLELKRGIKTSPSCWQIDAKLAANKVTKFINCKSFKSKSPICDVVFTVNGSNISVSLKEAFEVFAVPIPKLNAESRKFGLEFVCQAHLEKSPVFGHFWS